MWIIVYFCIVITTLAHSTDKSNRGAVVGGKQLDGFIGILKNLALSVGINESCIYTKNNYLPGYIYNIRKNGKQEGDVFTSPKVACYILDLIGYTPDKNLSQYNILGPSCGDGVFVIEIIHRILMSARHQCSRPDWQQTELEWRISTKSI